MESTRKIIKPLCIPVNITAKQGIEADILLPDYYDTIGKLIKCSVTPYCENYVYSSGKLSVSGCAEITVCYIGEDNKMYFYENRYKYTKIIPCDNSESVEAVNIRQENSSLTYRVLGPKRIEIKSIIHISADVYKSDSIEIISELMDSNLQYKNECESVCSNNRYVSHEFSVSNKDNPLLINDDIRFIIRKDCTVDFQEIKPISNKLYLSGNVNIRFIYISETDFSLKQNTVTIPVSEVLDFYGIEENSICNIISSRAAAEINIINKDTENTNIEVNVALSLFLHSYTECELEFISDAYAVDNATEASYINSDFMQCIEKTSKTVSVSFDLDSYESDNFSIVDCYIENICINNEIKNNKLNCLISADYNALLKTENGVFSLVCRNNNSEFEFDANEKTVKNISSRLLSVSALRLSDGKIRFNADIFISIEYMNVCKVNALTDIKIISDGTNYNKSEIVLYFAQKNESLWNIAKENKSSVSAIMQNNSLNSDILEKDMLLVFPNF